MKNVIIILSILITVSACGLLDDPVNADATPTFSFEELHSTADAMVIDMFTQTQAAMQTNTFVSPASTMIPPTNTAQIEKLCPSGNSDVDLSGLETMIELDDGSVIFRDNRDVEQAIVETLNEGGVEMLISYYSEKYSEKGFRAVDIISDSNLEIFVSVGRAILGYRCVDGIYGEFFRDAAFEYSSSILFLGDLNNNKKNRCSDIKNNMPLLLRCWPI